MTQPIQFPALAGDPPAKRAMMRNALRLFVVDGLDATSIRAIADSAGFTNPALFRHFPSKEALARHLFELCYRRIFSAINPAPQGSFEVRLADAVQRYLAVFDEAPEAVLYVHDTLRRFWRDMPPALRRQSLMGSMRKLIQSGIDEGQLEGGLDAQLAASAIIGSLAQIARMIYFGEFEGPAVAMAPKVLGLIRNMLR